MHLLSKNWWMLSCAKTLLLLGCLSMTAVALDTSASSNGSGKVRPTPDFTRDVRPILSQHCFTCHGPDDKKRKGGLRLDQRASAIAPAKSDALAIVPGKPDVSELIKRILTHDEDDLMPPPATKKPLSDKDKDVLKRWIAGGAEYQPHWAFAAPVIHPLPTVQNQTWSKNEIDRFVLARLEAEHVQPSLAADRPTLIRRVSLDLIGLPPTPAEVDAFVADTSPQAYEKLIDRLLASPHYGERWARQWMDLARYADTNGYEKDRPRSMWPWRDWVITAINDDMPFSEFTIKQIAGDMLPNATQSDRIATGFHRNTMINEEGGIDPLEFRFHAMADRVATTGKTWLGLTTGCAQCHTHKFDPVTITEYYQLMAMMNNADEVVMMIEPTDYAAQKNTVTNKIKTLVPPLVDQYPVDTRVWSPTTKITAVTASGEVASVAADGTITLNGPGAATDTYTITIETTSASLDFVQLEAMPNKNNPQGGPGRSSGGNFVLSEFLLTTTGLNSESATEKQAIKTFTADGEQKDYEAKFAIDGKKNTGWGIAGAGKVNATKTATATLKKTSHHDGGMRVVITLEQNFGEQHTLGQFRLRLGYQEDSKSTVEARRAKAELAFQEWLTEQRKNAVHWRVLTPVSATSETPTLTILDDGSILSSGDITKRDIYITNFKQDLAGVTAIRLEALTHDSLPNQGPGRVYYEGQSGDFLLTELLMSVNNEPVKFARGAESFAAGANNAAKIIDGEPLTGWTIRDGTGQSQAALLVCEKPLTAGSDVRIDLVFERYFASALGRYRFSVTTDPAPKDINYLPPDIAELVLRDSAKLDSAGIERLRRYWLTIAPELDKARKEIDALEKSLLAHPTSLVFKERPADHVRSTFIHNRGEFLQPTDRVEPGIFSALQPLSAGTPRNRLGLAQWLVARDNPLTARVTVNRWWATIFGRGLVRTIEDFGYQGEAPSHPALLDWLATTFMEDGWSMKRLHKRIVMSATYQQSSQITPQLLERDPKNILLGRGPRLRVEAEVIRDSLLTASGLLSPKLGGPSVFPPQPASVTSEGAYGKFDWKISDGPDRYRRGLYTFMKRTAPYAMTNAFDAPSGESCIAQREVSNSPLQALILLNDTVVMEAAVALGRKITSAPGDDTTRITALVRHCLVRSPTAQELSTMSAFITRQRQRFASKEIDPLTLVGKTDGNAVEIATWTTLARAMMNTDEFVTKE